MLAWPDIVIIIGYFVIVLGLGTYLTRYIKSQEDFFLAGRKMPWWIAACSLQATDIGPETYIGVTGVVAASGLAWLNYDWLPACAIPCIISAWFFVRHYRRSGVYTIPEFITSLLPVGAAGAAITALYAAGMSSCDSLLTSMSTVLTRDIYQRFLVKDRSDRHYLWAGRVSIILLLIFGTLFATKVFPIFGAAYEAWQSVLSYIQFPLFASLALGIFYRKATGLPAFVGLLAGSASAFLLDRFVGPAVAPHWWSFVWAGWAGGLITGAIIVVGSRFTTPYPDDKLKGLCWGITGEEPEEAPRLLLDWRLWSVVSLVLGVSLTLLFWLVL
jgi:Na+/proline symporter